ncbi:MAG: hypothetical protein IPH76_11940 [Xanthomonadales bacterium]|nr:hypothetical protein [Xanthomonadales bacterium]
MKQDKDERGIHRTFRRVERRFPGRFAHFLRWLRQPGSRWVRVPLAALFSVAGVVGFLPVVGFWMLPLGLLLLAQDLPLLRRPMRRLLVCSERRWRKRQWARSGQRKNGAR